MLLYFSNFRCQASRFMMITVGLLVLTVLSPDLYAQEEDLFGDSEGDSLLFGDEFDLGGDDFSFETDEETSTETDAGGEDDFFGDFEDEEETEVEAESDSAEVDEWGIDTDTDYESLITRTADGDILEEIPDHPLELGK